MRICVIDDHPLVLEGIAARLRGAGHEVEAAGEFDDAAQLLANGACDLLLLDYHLGGRKGPELLSLPGVAAPRDVVILSAMTDPEDILYALAETAASAYILKSIALEDLSPALEQVRALDHELRGHCLWDTERRGFVAVHDAFPHGSVLTPREREVFMLLRTGLLDKQIAEHLQRSVHTVRVQIRAIRRKRGQTRRAEVSF